MQSNVTQYKGSAWLEEEAFWTGRFSRKNSYSCNLKLNDEGMEIQTGSEPIFVPYSDFTFIRQQYAALQFKTADGKGTFFYIGADQKYLLDDLKSRKIGSGVIQPSKIIPTYFYIILIVVAISMIGALLYVFFSRFAH